MNPEVRESRICTGGCHCGRVRFEVNLPTRVVATHCNCSICTMTGFVHLIVESTEFRLLEGEAFLAEYRFNTQKARHLFCRECGVKSFYVPRSHPDGYSVNLNCVELHPEMEVHYERFEGRNWEENIQGLLDQG